ncbi:type I glutamate--ammonia ligase [Caminibacter sp.]
MKIKEFIQECKDREIEFVDFRFTDIKGVWHHVTYDIDAIDEEILRNGLPFDGSSIPAWQPINESDMVLKPDLEIGTHFVDPFTADPTMVVFCDVYNTDGTPYEKCPRSIAKKALKYMEEQGIADTAYFGPENEFFVFENVVVRDEINAQCYEVDTAEGAWNDYVAEFGDELNIGHRPRTKGGYFPVPPVDSMMDLRAEMAKVLKEVGLQTFVLHHEVAQGQGEIGVKFGTLIEAADNVQKLKYVVKMVAHLNGKTATFMPKPLYGDNGSGMHTHISLWKDGKNLFYGDGYANLSKLGLNFIGGVLKYAPSVAAFTNASTNSYKRLIPGFEAPSILTYSAKNRSASCRIPWGAGEKSVRAEFRFPDSSSCPYLAFTALLMAGLEGIKNEIDPGEPMEIDLFELTLDEIREKGIRQLPHTLREAVEEMLKNKELFKQGNVMTEDFIQTYQHYKFESEIWPWEGRPHPYEFITTYSC